MTTKGTPPRFVLDTSVLIAFFEGRAYRVKEILAASARADADALISFVSLLEIAVVRRRKADARDRRTQEARDLEAERTLTDLAALPLRVVPESAEIRWLASGFKARGGLSLGDAYVIATAEIEGATLVHVDAEFEKFGEIRQERL